MKQFIIHVANHRSYILRQQWYLSVCLFVCLSIFSYRQGRGRGRGRAARVDTRPLFSVTDRAGQGRAARADTRPLFSVTLAFPGCYLLAAPHELFPTMAIAECCQFIKLVQRFKSKEYVKASVLAWKKGGSAILNKWV